jgi:hypothetical protein
VLVVGDNDGSCTAGLGICKHLANNSLGKGKIFYVYTVFTVSNHFIKLHVIITLRANILDNSYLLVLVLDLPECSQCGNPVVSRHLV